MSRIVSRVLFSSAVVSLWVVALAAQVTTLDTWFDLEKCSYCKTWAAQPGLCEHEREEIVNLSNGIVWITYVEPAYRKQYGLMQAAEAKVSDDLSAGKPVTLCQPCSMLNNWAEKGVHMESVHASDAELTLLTSADTTLVRQLQDFGKIAISKWDAAKAQYKKGRK